MRQQRQGLRPSSDLPERQRSFILSLTSMVDAMTSGKFPTNSQIDRMLATLHDSPAIGQLSPSMSQESRQLWEDVRSLILTLRALIRDKNQNENLQRMLHHLYLAESAAKANAPSMATLASKLEQRSYAAPESLQALSAIASNEDLRTTIKTLGFVLKGMFEGIEHRPHGEEEEEERPENFWDRPVGVDRNLDWEVPQPREQQFVKRPAETGAILSELPAEEDRDRERRVEMQEREMQEHEDERRRARDRKAELGREQRRFTERGREVQERGREIQERESALGQEQRKFTDRTREQMRGREELGAEQQRYRQQQVRWQQDRDDREAGLRRREPRLRDEEEQMRRRRDEMPRRDAEARRREEQQRRLDDEQQRREEEQVEREERLKKRGQRQRDLARQQELLAEQQRELAREQEEEDARSAAASTSKRELRRSSQQIGAGREGPAKTPSRASEKAPYVLDTLMQSHLEGGDDQTRQGGAAEPAKRAKEPSKELARVEETRSPSEAERSGTSTPSSAGPGNPLKPSVAAKLEDEGATPASGHDVEGEEDLSPTQQGQSLDVFDDSGQETTSPAQGPLDTTMSTRDKGKRAADPSGQMSHYYGSASESTSRKAMEGSERLKEAESGTAGPLGEVGGVGDVARTRSEDLPGYEDKDTHEPEDVTAGQPRPRPRSTGDKPFEQPEEPRREMETDPKRTVAGAWRAQGEQLEKLRAATGDESKLRGSEQKARPQRETAEDAGRVAGEDLDRGRQWTESRKPRGGEEPLRAVRRRESEPRIEAEPRIEPETERHYAEPEIRPGREQDQEQEQEQEPEPRRAVSRRGGRLSDAPLAQGELDEPRRMELIAQLMGCLDHFDVVPAVRGTLIKTLATARSHLDQASGKITAGPAMADDANLRQASKEFKRLVERLANNYSLDTILATFKTFGGRLAQDSKLHDLFERGLQFVQQAVEDRDYRRSGEAIFRGSSWLQDARQHLSREYSGETTTLAREIDNFIDQLLDDTLSNELMTNAKRVATDIWVVRGNEAYVRPQVLRDMMTLVGPMIFQQLSVVRIPQLSHSAPNVDIVVDEFDLHTRTLLPSRIHLRTADELTFGVRDERAHDFAKELHMRIDDIMPNVSNVPFAVLTKGTYPKLRDRGYVDLNVMDDVGCSVHVTLGVFPQDPEMTLELRHVDVDIGKIRIHVHGSKHDRLYGMLTPFFNRVAKYHMIRTVREQLEKAIERIDQLLTQAKRETSPHAVASSSREMMNSNVDRFLAVLGFPDVGRYSEGGRIDPTAPGTSREARREWFRSDTYDGSRTSAKRTSEAVGQSTRGGSQGEAIGASVGAPWWSSAFD
nr:hypothetical protein HK105_000419 [Polyrhizophydium stewartii]